MIGEILLVIALPVIIAVGLLICCCAFLSSTGYASLAVGAILGAIYVAKKTSEPGEMPIRKEEVRNEHSRLIHAVPVSDEIYVGYMPPLHVQAHQDLEANEDEVERDMQISSAPTAPRKY